MRFQFLAGLFTLVALPAFAQDTAETPDPEAPAAQFEVELNGAADTPEGNCRLTYVARNRTEQAIDDVAYEFGIFDTEGRVTQIVAFSFGSMVAGRTRILQFDVGGLACGDVSQIIVNDAIVCTVDGTESSDFCISTLATRTLTDLQFGL